MGLFDKFKNQKKTENGAKTDPQDRYSNPERADSNKVEQKEEIIECFDAYGRKIMISKKEWLDKVLPDQLKQHWNNPSMLYNDILFAIQDGIAEYVIEAAKHLNEIDNIKERGYVILSIVYMKVNRYNEAQEVLEEYMDNYGKTGTVLTNLAKTYEAQGKHQECLETLWEGLQLDPNQENGLAWLLAIKHEEGGQESYVNALNEVCNINGSYLPQLYLARNYIEDKNIDRALKLYEILIQDHCSKDDVLFMMSGDMAQAGLIKEMLEYIVPLYDVNKNDVRIGFNLLQGYLMTNNVKEGQKLLSDMMQLNRPDIRQYLMQMSGKLEEIDDSDEKQNIQDTQQMEMCSIHKPIWHYGLGDMKCLNTPVNTETASKIGVIVYSSANTNGDGQAYSEKETNLGRLTRSVPLFLNELIYYYTDYQTITFVPVIRGVGPILSGHEWDDTILRQLAKNNGLVWIISGNASMVQDKLCVTTKMLNVSADTVYCIEDMLSTMNMGVPLMEHISKVFKYITGFDLSGQNSNMYSIPKNVELLEYLNGIGQSLIQTLIDNEITPLEKMYGERNIINNYIMSCLHMPDNIQAPIIMASGLAKSKSYSSNVYMEFKDQVLKLVDDFEKQNRLNNEIVEKVKGLY